MQKTCQTCLDSTLQIRNLNIFLFKTFQAVWQWFWSTTANKHCWGKTSFFPGKIFIHFPFERMLNLIRSHDDDAYVTESMFYNWIECFSLFICISFFILSFSVSVFVSFNEYFIFSFLCLDCHLFTSLSSTVFDQSLIVLHCLISKVVVLYFSGYQPLKCITVAGIRLQFTYITAAFSI